MNTIPVHMMKATYVSKQNWHTLVWKMQLDMFHMH